jgi:hypothetical protein
MGCGQVRLAGQKVRLLKRDFSVSRKAESLRDAAQIKKFDQDEQIVWGEVYAPGFPDSQGDYMTPEEIKKMAYGFMRKGALANVDTNHSQQPNGSRIVESFIARKGDPVFIPGSWVVGVHVPDSATWRMIKSGELNGFSLDGFGVRTEKPIEVELPHVLKGETLPMVDHSHSFSVRFAPDGRFMGGMTNPGLDGHVHKIERGTVTEKAGFPPHVHRFSFVEGVLNAQDAH